MKNYLKFFALSLFVFLTFCQTTKTENGVVNLKTSNSDKNVSDSTQAETSYDKLKNELIKSYTDTIKIDTTFKRDFKLHVRYYCLFDSSLNIPAKYNWGNRKLVFRTHNFASRIQLYQEDHKVLDTVLTKSIFDPLLFTALIEYGVLNSPIYYYDKNRIFLGYDISIPLTDVGKRVYLIVDEGGNILISDKK